MVITVSCPACQASFPADPNKIPEAGVKVRCSQCAHVFRVERPVEEAPADVAPAVPEPTSEEAPAEEAAPEWSGAEATSTDVAEPTDVETAEPTDAETGVPEAAETGGELHEPEQAETDDWGVERDAFETADAEQPAEEPDPEDVPDGGAELPDWASVGGDEISLVDPAQPEDLPDIEVDTPAVSDLEEALPDAAAEIELPDPEPVLDDVLPGALAEPEEVLPETEEVLSEAESVVEDALPEPETVPSESAPAPTDAPVQGFTFGKRDPMDKARRLARVLVSDMVMYNAERHQVALSRGTLAEDFEEEIDKSWKEYVDQLGSEIADGQGQEFWTQALNDILAKGEQVF